MTPETPAILLVEDDPSDRELARYALEQIAAGVELRVAEDGEDALAYLNGSGPYADRSLHPLPAAMILDLKLPRKSGFEVLAWARASAEFRRLPIFILTSSTEPRDLSRARELGADAYHVKSPDLDELQSIIGKIVVAAGLTRGRE